MSTKRIYFLLILQFSILNIHYSFAQGGTWTWISGSNIPNDTGIYGTQGVASVNNHPPGLLEAANWKDKQGNFWLYGGGNDSVYPNDLWKYNPVTNEWTWVKGSGPQASFSLLPVYGTKGIADTSNTPGSRAGNSEHQTPTRFFYPRRRLEVGCRLINTFALNGKRANSS